MRHNAIRDTAASFLREAKFKDVRIELALLTVQPSSFSRKTNTQDGAGIDVAAVGLYAPFSSKSHFGLLTVRCLSYIVHGSPLFFLFFISIIIMACG